jgi:hypothetical protein
MAITAAPYGLRPVNLIGGQSFTGSTRLIKINNAYSANIFYGQPVSINAAGVVIADTGTSNVAATGVVGVFVGCTYTDPNLKYKLFRQMWPSGTVATDAFAYVVDDPDVVMQAQADGALTQADLGINIGFGTSAGDAATGNSETPLAVSTKNTTATLPLRIVGFVDGPDSAVGDAYTDVLVKWNAPAVVYAAPTADNAQNSTVTVTYGHAYQNPTGV